MMSGKFKFKRPRKLQLINLIVFSSNKYRNNRMLNANDVKNMINNIDLENY